MFASYYYLFSNYKSKAPVNTSFVQLVIWILVILDVMNRAYCFFCCIFWCLKTKYQILNFCIYFFVAVIIWKEKGQAVCLFLFWIATITFKFSIWYLVFSHQLMQWKKHMKLHVNTNSKHDGLRNRYEPDALSTHWYFGQLLTGSNLII